MGRDRRDTLLISAMLDVHYPLLRCAFDSRRYRAVVLEEGTDVVNLGLHYTQNDLCYPGVLIIGQFIAALRGEGFDTPPPFAAFRRRAEGAVTFGCEVGDGWLIGAEIANHALDGCGRILCVQPFGCLASHVCGRGVYAALGRKFPQTRLVNVDYDSSGTPVAAERRIRMLLEDF